MSACRADVPEDAQQQLHGPHTCKLLVLGVERCAMRTVLRSRKPSSLARIAIRQLYLLAQWWLAVCEWYVSGR
jgi:hypothetical protein